MREKLSVSALCTELEVAHGCAGGGVLLRLNNHVSWIKSQGVLLLTSDRDGFLHLALHIGMVSMSCDCKYAGSRCVDVSMSTPHSLQGVLAMLHCELHMGPAISGLVVNE